MAYADYHKVMEITENMVAYVCDQVLGKRILEFRGNTIDINPPWQRLELRQGIINTTGIDINAFPTAEGLEGAMKEKGYPFKPGSPRGKLVDALIGDYLEPTLLQPTFLYDYPRDISPLAKSKPGDTSTVERFEGFIAGMELCNAFSELNDPLDQEQRFLEMGNEYESDDEERHPMDEDYLRAMSYGMPPMGGFGMGVDRLVMLLTNQQTIREVLLFPHLRKLEE
jgi:lysyl-tRNA synthetase class 2